MDMKESEQKGAKGEAEVEVGKVALASEPVLPESALRLREVFPQFVKDGEIDFDALKAFFDAEGATAGEEKYGLSWAGKREAFRAIRTQATGTLAPQRGESKEWDATGNVFLEGDNLEALKLLQKHYRDAIKMIYIDPPYNTGKDFIYKDNFTEGKNDYYERTGQSEGGVKLTSNPESAGRYHSDWLTMMYPRLFLAKNLLRQDGVIFVSIDDNEVANLRLIMDEIFGEENFEGQIHWRRRHNQPNDPTKLIATVAEHIIVYARNSISLRKAGVGKLDLTGKFSNPDNDSRGEWNSKPWKAGSNQGGSRYKIILPSGRAMEAEWMGDEETYQQLLADNRIYFPKDGEGLPRKKIFMNERLEAGQSATNWFENGNFGNNQDATEELAELLGGNKNIFENPKPTKLVKNLVRLGNVGDGEIILDFFAGSGTTAHAVMAQNAEDGGNRKWICVQIPEATDEKSEAYKAGYKTISVISRERIRRAGEKIAKGDTGFKVFTLAPSNYRKWHVLTQEDDVEALKAQTKLFAEKPLIDGYDEESVVYEVLLKEGFDLTAHVQKETRGDLPTWLITDGERAMCITLAPTFTRAQFDALALTPETTFVCLDSALDDSLKLNIARQVRLKVI